MLIDVLRRGGPGCSALREALVRHRAELDAEDPSIGDTELLAAIAALRLDPRDKRTPLGSVMPGRIPGVSELTDAALARLRELLPELPPADLRARIWDVLWLRARRDHDAAHNSVGEYVRAARDLAPVDHSGWDTPATRLRRAATVAGAVKSEDLLNTVRDCAEGLVRD